MPRPAWSAPWPSVGTRPPGRRCSVYSPPAALPVRLAAIGLLVCLGEPADAHVLIRLLSEGPPDEQAAARSSLSRMPGAPVSATIAEAIGGATALLRVTLIEILGQRRRGDGCPHSAAGRRSRPAGACRGDRRARQTGRSRAHPRHGPGGAASRGRPAAPRRPKRP